MSRIYIDGIISENELSQFEKKLIHKLDQIIENSKGSREWLNTHEAIEYLRIGQTKFYDLVNKGVIHQFDLGGKKLYNTKQLREAVEND